MLKNIFNKMKILLLAHSFPPVVGGGESHVFMIAQHLARKGHKVYVITGRAPKEQKRSLPKAGFKTVRIPFFREYAFGKEGFKKFIPVLYQEIKKIKPDIINLTPLSRQ